MIRELTGNNEVFNALTNINEGFFRDDVNYEIVGRLFDAIGKYVVDNQLYRQYTIEELFHNLVFVSLRGMCTEKGVKALAKML